MRLRSRILPLATALALAGAAHAQTDTSGYGGPDGSDIYDELAPEVVEDAAAEIDRAARALGLLCDVNDSLTMIPGYDMYCHWNTDVIFDRASTCLLYTSRCV